MLKAKSSCAVYISSSQVKGIIKEHGNMFPKEKKAKMKEERDC